MKTIYGVSRGETGEFGIGQIFKGTNVEWDEEGGTFLLDGEPVYSTFTIVNNTIDYN